MKKRVVFVHGWDGNPNDSWKPWIKKILEKKKIEVIAPQFPGGENPLLEEWINTLNESVGKCDGKTYFVGHSLGCIAILRYFEQLSSGQRVGGCVLIAGFVRNLEPQLNNFTEAPLNLGKIKSVCSKFIVIGSRDDDVVSLGEVLELQNRLKAEIILDNGKGHFSEGDCIRELPSLLSSLEKIMRK